MKAQNLSVGILFYFHTLALYKGSTLEVFSSRIKRNTVEERYFIVNKILQLPCFDDKLRPDDDEIISYRWHYGGYEFADNDLDDYENYDANPVSKGDLIVKSPKGKNIDAVCRAAVEGEQYAEGESDKIRKQYKLIEATSPTISLTINEKEYPYGFTGSSTGVKNVTCEASGGVPPSSKVTLWVQGNVVGQDQNMVSSSVKLDYESNVKAIKCEAQSSFEQLQPVKKNISLDITFSPVMKKGEMEEVHAAVGDVLTIPFRVFANPAPSDPKWSFLSNCSSDDELTASGTSSDFDDRYTFEEPKERNPGDSSYEYEWLVTIATVEESDLSRCIFLSLANAEGNEVFKKRITVADTASGGFIAGIVFGVLAALLLIVVLGGFLWKKYGSRTQSYSAPHESHGMENSGG